MKERNIDLNIQLGKKIKEYREYNNFTQDFVSKELDLATNHYGRIERGENSCTINNFIKLCNILKITPNDLLNETIFNKNDDFFTHYNKLNIEDKELLKQISILLLSKYKNK